MAHPGPAIVNDSFAPRLALVYAALFLAAGWQLPLFPLWLSARGLDPVAIGIVLAAYQAVRIPAIPAATRLADRHGSLRNAIVAAAAATAGAVVLLGTSSGIGFILAAAVLLGCVSAPLLPLVDAYGLKGLSLRARNYGPVRLWGSVAFIAANLTGGLLLGVVAAQNLIWLIFTGNCAILAAALMLVRVPREISRASGARSHSHLRDPAFLAMAAAGSLIQASHAVYYGFATLDWSQKGFDGLTIGVLWALGVVAEIVLFAFAGRLGLGPVALVAIGAGGAILRWIATAFDPPLALLAPLQVLHALSFGATHLGTMLYLGRAAPGSGRAAAQGDIATANTVMMAAASAFAGVLYGAGGSRAYFAMAMLAAAGGACAMAAARLLQPHSTGAAG